ncbi:VanZ family protein [Nocardia jejuensis]|uniref:VanZ family protein n=1 Tax=Nocardia jejuensis TaxID=328049 RepID=UPI000833DF8F|nr:VanZ family protein [Nocardia jejuensis]
MRQIWDSWGDVLVAWAIAVPLVTGVARAVSRERIRRGRPPAEARRRTFAEAGIALGTLPWIWMILTPTGGERHVILIPFLDLAETITEASFNTFVQIFANVIVFVPLGFLLPLRFPRCANTLRMALLGAAISATLEAAQYLFDLGRFSSIDDVLMNATGAALGAYLTTRLVPPLPQPDIRDRELLTNAE